MDRTESCNVAARLLAGLGEMAVHGLTGHDPIKVSVRRHDGRKVRATHARRKIAKLSHSGRVRRLLADADVGPSYYAQAGPIADGRVPLDCECQTRHNKSDPRDHAEKRYCSCPSTSWYGHMERRLSSAIRGVAALALAAACTARPRRCAGPAAARPVATT